MYKKKHSVLIILITTMLCAFQPAVVQAHTPGPMTLTYNFDTQVLTVSVTHIVSDSNTHYIYEIVIEKNSVIVITESYTSQESTSGMSDNFDVSAIAGDVIRATAKCIISGQVSGQITIQDSATETSTTTTSADAGIPMTMILILSAIIALAVILVIYIMMKRR